MKLDPVGVVRNALERMEYQLDPAWYSWGTEAPRVVGLENADTSVYSSLINDIKKILQQNGINGMITNDIIEQALFKNNDENIIDSIDSIHFFKNIEV